MRRTFNFYSSQRYFSNWKQLSFNKKDNNNPIGRCGSAGFYFNNELFLYAGDIASPPTGVSCNDFWKFNLLNKTWNEIIINDNKPSKRYGHSMCKINKNSIIMHGGSSDAKNRLGDTWLYNIESNTWKELSKEGPELDLHVPFYNNDNKMFIYGGRHIEDKPTTPGKLYEFNLNNNTWNEILTNNSPHVSFNGHSGILMNDNDSFIVYGPGYPSILIPEQETGLWKYSISSNTWSQLPSNNGPPSPRFHQVITSISDSEIIIVGGGTFINKEVSWKNNDIWKYNLNSLSWEEIKLNNGPNGLVASLLINDNNNLYFIGGENANRDCTNEIWQLE